MARIGRMGEFELIARYFAPLARGFKGAGGLKSDNAFLSADPKHDLVVKTDTIVSGVHFLADEKPEFVAAKALRVCLSDLAAGGGTPFTYQLSLSLSKGWKESWVAGFARGLAADQRRYGIVLCGGDTVVSPGPLTVTITAFGRVPRGRGLARAGARAGDQLWVSGTIGDGALGLLAARGRLDSSGSRETFQAAATPHDTGSAPGRHRIGDGRCFRWFAGRCRPHRRSFAAGRGDRTRARAAVGWSATCARDDSKAVGQHTGRWRRLRARDRRAATQAECAGRDGGCGGRAGDANRPLHARTRRAAHARRPAGVGAAQRLRSLLRSWLHCKPLPANRLGQGGRATRVRGQWMVS